MSEIETQSAAPASTTRTGDVREIYSTSPLDGHKVGAYPSASQADVDRAVAVAAGAGEWWSNLTFRSRSRHLRRVERHIAIHRAELADLIHEENGKPHEDAMLEIALTLEHLRWARRHARRTLAPSQVWPGVLSLNQRAYVERNPYGVVAVIGPWNYPVFTPMGSISYALAAGNTVVHKPSEHTPAVGQWLAEAFASAIRDHPVVQVVQGNGAVGEALCRSRVGKLAFTGSAATGRRVAQLCGSLLTPTVLELGGNDCAIVCADADINDAADLVAWGALQNAGQACIGIERVYVVDEVADRFIGELARRVSDLMAAPNGQLGPMTVPAQEEIVKAHVADAIGAGAAIVAQGTTAFPSGVAPVVVADPDPDCRLMTEETFGPVIPVRRVRDVDAAVAEANRGEYGLGAAVFSKRQGEKIAAGLRVGMVSVNGVATFAGVGALPFGGVKGSGYGRIHGADGLREFAFAKAITRRRMKLAWANPLSFERPAWLPRALDALVRVRHG